MGPVCQPLDPDPEPGRPDDALEVLDQGQAPARQRRLTASPSRGKQPASLHRFCQFDFPFPPGPADGRYLVRGDGDAADVIAVTTLGAELKRPGLGRRSARRRPSRAEPAAEPAPVAVTRVTVIRGQPIESPASAREWLERCRRMETASAEVAQALRLLNRAIHAHRVSAADPYVGDVGLGQARRVRLGYGAGDELVEGRWREAYAVPPQVTRGGRRRMLAPDEQLARILGGRRPTYPSEDLLLRSRLDLDQGRPRAAALQAGAARAALVGELRGEGTGAQTQKALQGHEETLARLASAAVARELDEDELGQLEEIVVEMERFARRRRHAAGDDDR